MLSTSQTESTNAAVVAVMLKLDRLEETQFHLFSTLELLNKPEPTVEFSLEPDCYVVSNQPLEDNTLWTESELCMCSKTGKTRRMQSDL